MVTHCMGPFARTLSGLPAERDKWQALIDKQPEACPKDCGQSCRDVCKGYANVQWRCVQGKRK